MPNLLYESTELIAVQERAPTQTMFFLDRFFRRTVYSTAAEIAFDEVMRGLPVMAPFVSPIVQAKPQKRFGVQMKSFAPAYVKPKHFVKPGDFVNRRPGEPLNGIPNLAARRDAAIVDLLEYQKEQIRVRQEWMAAQAVIRGQVTIAGEDYPSVLVDFGRDAALSITVSGATNMWNDHTNAPIIDQLEAWSALMLEKSGYAGTDVIMSPEIWPHFRANAQVLRDADLRRAVTNVPNLQPQVAVEGVKNVGSWGEFNLWIYSGKFIDQDGASVRPLAADEILITAAPNAETGGGGINGIRCFGAIQDMDANLQAIEMYPKMWREQDPSGEQLMTQSAPLMVPGRPNASVLVNVM